MVRHQLFPQKPPGSCLRFSRTGIQPSLGSSTIELPSAFAKSGAYLPDRELAGSPRHCSLPLACRHPLEGHQIGARKRRTPANTIFSQPYHRRVSIDRPNREGSQLAASLEGEPGPTPAGKILPHSYPETRFRREPLGHENINRIICVIHGPKKLQRWVTLHLKCHVKQLVYILYYDVSPLVHYWVVWLTPDRFINVMSTCTN